MSFLKRLAALLPEFPWTSAARMNQWARWNAKVLGSELARQRFEMGMAGPNTVLPASPVRAGLTSRICYQADIETDWLRYWCRELRCAPLYHRKVWEDCYAAQALWEGGALKPGRRGLGFAVGREPLPSLFASLGVDILATDLQATDRRATGWIRTGQHIQRESEAAAAAPFECVHHEKIVDRSAFVAHVSSQAADMTAIPADFSGRFDFLWSVCAFEHLGSIDNGLDFVVNAMRCLKPGGLAVHTTEYNLDADGRTVSRGPTVLFQRRHIQELERRLAADGHQMKRLIDRPGKGVLDRFVDLPPYAATNAPAGFSDAVAPHLRLAVRGYPVTSVGLIIRAAKERSA